MLQKNWFELKMPKESNLNVKMKRVSKKLIFSKYVKIEYHDIK
jgi:hypothetical protein